MDGVANPRGAAGRDPAADMERVAALIGPLFEASSEQSIYSHLAEALRQVLGDDAIIAVSSLDPARNMYRPQAFAGLEPILERILGLIGSQPVDLIGDYPPEVRRFLAEGRLLPVPGGVEELAGGVLPADLLRRAVALAGLADVYVVGFAHGGCTGGVSIITRRRGLPIPRPTIEALARLAAAALEHRRLDVELRACRQRLDQANARIQLLAVPPPR